MTTKAKAKRNKGHAIVEHKESREIVERMCAQRGCKFFGKAAQQGVCYDDEGALAAWAKLEAHEKELVAELKAMKKREGKAYVRALEAYYITAMMNWDLTLDECIRLRRDLARAKRRR